MQANSISYLTQETARQPLSWFSPYVSETDSRVVSNVKTQIFLEKKGYAPLKFFILQAMQCQHQEGQRSFALFEIAKR